MTSYRIKAGDTLSRIAAKAGISVKELVALNGISNPNKVRAGQVIQLSAAPRSAPSTARQTALDSLGASGGVRLGTRVDYRRMPSTDAMAAAVSQSGASGLGAANDPRTSLLSNVSRPSMVTGRPDARVGSMPLGRMSAGSQGGRISPPSLASVGGRISPPSLAGMGGNISPPSLASMGGRISAPSLASVGGRGLPSIEDALRKKYGGMVWDTPSGTNAINGLQQFEGQPLELPHIPPKVELGGQWWQSGGMPNGYAAMLTPAAYRVGQEAPFSVPTRATQIYPATRMRSTQSGPPNVGQESGLNLTAFQPPVQSPPKGPDWGKMLDAINPLSVTQAQAYPLTGKGLAGENPVFKERLQALFDMPDAPQGLSVGSGYRSQAHQNDLYAASGGSGYVAKKSLHTGGVNGGMAADLYYNGQRLDHAPAAVQQWVKDQAPTVGLTIPMHSASLNEPWHIEPIEARTGMKPNYNADLAPIYRGNPALTAINTMAPTPASRPTALGYAAPASAPAPQINYAPTSTAGATGVNVLQAATKAPTQPPAGAVPGDRAYADWAAARARAGYALPQYSDPTPLYRGNTLLGGGSAANDSNSFVSNAQAGLNTIGNFGQSIYDHFQGQYNQRQARDALASSSQSYRQIPGAGEPGLTQAALPPAKVKYVPSTYTSLPSESPVGSMIHGATAAQQGADLGSRVGAMAGTPMPKTPAVNPWAPMAAAGPMAAPSFDPVGPGLSAPVGGMDAGWNQFSDFAASGTPGVVTPPVQANVPMPRPRPQPAYDGGNQTTAYVPPMPKQMVTLASGKRIAVGDYPSSQGNGHQVRISDAGDGTAHIVNVSPSADMGLPNFPGFFDPMRELQMPTVAGGIERHYAPGFMQALANGDPNPMGHFNLFSGFAQPKQDPVSAALLAPRSGGSSVNMARVNRGQQDLRDSGMLDSFGMIK